MSHLRGTSDPAIYRKRPAFEMPGVLVDGMDVLKVREVANDAIGRARTGEGPSLIECETYRFSGHSLADPDKLRDADIVGPTGHEMAILLNDVYLILSDPASRSAYDEMRMHRSRPVRMKSGKSTTYFQRWKPTTSCPTEGLCHLQHSYEEMGDALFPVADDGNSNNCCC